MKKLALGAISACLIFLAFGCCPIDKKAVSDVKASYEKSRTYHLKYVEKDAALKPADKEDWVKFYDAYKRLIEALEKAVD